MGDLTFEGKLLVCDMDGTLINSKNELSKENIEAIKYFVDGGGLFTIATGRSAQAVGLYKEILPINVPVIVSNGTLIYDFVSSSAKWHCGLKEDVEGVLINLMKEFPGLGVEVFTASGVHIANQNDVTESHRLREVILPGVFTLEEILKPWDKIVLAWDNENLKKVEKYLIGRSGTSRTVFSEEVFLDLLNPGASKGAALEELIFELGLKAEDVIAVGDNLNDLEMIKIAGVGVAVENAHEGLKKYADLCTIHHDDHAVAEVVKWIEKNM